jgi:sugar lactone lactonase YvrE
MIRSILISLSIFSGLLLLIASVGVGRVPASVAAAPLRATTTLAMGFGSPDDVAIMPSGAILFGDFSNKALNILQPGSSTPEVLAAGFIEPEGIVVTKDGAIIVAEQKNNSLVEVNPSTGTKKTLRVIRNVTGKDGIDGLGYDPVTGDILVPDSPHGTLLRMSRDGSKLTTIATGFVRPTGAAVEANGSILVADEFGNVVYRLNKSGRRSIVARVYQPDDVVVGPSGTIYVNSLNGNIWAINPKTLVRRVLVSGLKLPHGLAVDKSGLVLAEAGRNRILRLPLTNP